MSVETDQITDEENTIAAEILALSKKKAEIVAVSDVVEIPVYDGAPFIFNRDNGRILPYDEQLTHHLTNWYMCDDQGKPV